MRNVAWRAEKICRVLLANVCQLMEDICLMLMALLPVKRSVSTASAHNQITVLKRKSQSARVCQTDELRAVAQIQFPENIITVPLYRLRLH